MKIRITQAQYDLLYQAANKEIDRQNEIINEAIKRKCDMIAMITDLENGRNYDPESQQPKKEDLK